MAYVCRDIERCAFMYGLPVRVPAPYPLAEWDTANRAAMLGATEGWIAGYTQATYRRWHEGLEPGSEPNLFESLREISRDPSRMTALAATPDIGTAHEAVIGRARDLGIGGSPTFRAGHDLFWGDEHLNDAIAWYRRSTLAGA